MNTLNLILFEGIEREGLTDIGIITFNNETICTSLDFSPEDIDDKSDFSINYGMEAIKEHYSVLRDSLKPVLTAFTATIYTFDYHHLKTREDRMELQSATLEEILELLRYDPSKIIPFCRDNEKFAIVEEQVCFDKTDQDAIAYNTTAAKYVPDIDQLTPEAACEYKQAEDELTMYILWTPEDIQDTLESADIPCNRETKAALIRGMNKILGGSPERFKQFALAYALSTL